MSNLQKIRKRRRFKFWVVLSTSDTGTACRVCGSQFTGFKSAPLNRHFHSISHIKNMEALNLTPEGAPLNTNKKPLKLTKKKDCGANVNANINILKELKDSTTATCGVPDSKPFPNKDVPSSGEDETLESQGNDDLHLSRSSRMESSTPDTGMTKKQAVSEGSPKDSQIDLLNDEEFLEHFTRSTIPNKFTCIACGSDHTSVSRFLRAHLNTYTYQVNCGQIESSEKFDPDAATAEIRLAAMTADRNLSFLFSEDLVDIIKDIAYDSDILQSVKLDRKKISDILNEVIAPAQKQRLINYFQVTQFSFSIDESTDISVHSSICIVVRFYDPEREKECDSLLEVIPAYASRDENAKVDATYVAEAVLAVFDDAAIPRENIISFCSDTCNLMMGRCHSVATKLQEALPHITIVKCPCHIEHLVAQDSMKILPPECVDFMANLHSYINSSPKRKHNWFVAQKKVVGEELNVLRPYSIRWLSYYNVILRILRRWSTLELYFERESYENPDTNGSPNEKSAEGILRQLEDPFMKGYFLFLEAYLSRLVRINECLQSEQPIVPQYNNKITEVYTEFLKMYMVEDYVNSNDISDIDPKDKNNFKPISQVYIGKNTEAHLKEMSETSEIDDDDEDEDFVVDFRTMCQEVLIECCVSIKKRCNFKEERHFFHP